MSQQDLNPRPLEAGYALSMCLPTLPLERLYHSIKLIYGEVSCNSRLARRLYRQHFSISSLPNCRTFVAISQTLNTESFQPQHLNCAPQGQGATSQAEEQILDTIA